MIRPMLKAAAVRALATAGYEMRCVRDVAPAMLDASRRRELEFRDVVCRLMHDLGRTSLSFVQVGAFDGVSCDPIREFVVRHDWRGVLLEPQPEAFAELVRNYGDRAGLIFRNAAVAESAGHLTLHTVDAEGLPAWCGGLASFSRDSIEKHEPLVPGLSRRIVSRQVPTVTFDEVLDALGAPELHVLQIDTEGFDAEVVGMFPFRRMRPAVVHFERKHLSPTALDRCLSRLSGFGYRFAYDGGEDMTAVLDPTPAQPGGGPEAPAR